MSFFQRISADANNACQDLYSSWILGDDAGKSARFTLIVRPFEWSSKNNKSSTYLPNKNSSPRSNKLPQHLDLGMTFIEINGRAYVRDVTPESAAARAGIMPQDAVQYACMFRTEWIQEPSSSSSSSSSSPQTRTNHNSSREQFQQDPHPDDEDRRTGSGSKSKTSNNNINNSNDPDTVVDSLAIRHVLQLESQGMRIAYNELCRLLAEAIDPTQSAFLSPPSRNKPQGHFMQGTGAAAGGGGGTMSYGSWKGPPIPSNICVPIMEDATYEGAAGGGMITSSSKEQHQHVAPEDEAASYVHQQHLERQVLRTALSHPPSPYKSDMPRPVVFCFRRSRQRKQALHHLGLPAFRLDDECDFASSLVRRLAPTGDMEIPPPDTWEELVHDGTDWLLGTGSMLPPKHNHHSMAIASGTAATTTHATNGLSVGASGTAYSGAMSGIREEGNRNHSGRGSSGRNQEPIDGNTSLVAPLHKNSHNNNINKHDDDPDGDDDDDDDDDDLDGSDDHAIPLDSFEKERARKVASLRSRMAAEAMQVDRTDDVEAVTIRGMIQKAVGLAFVRASKVVLGISLHGGSGIVLARLSDGTWSAPSAIGTWGFGLGLQFGLEVAEYIFILQTPEALDHFRRGGSFTVGGNMGVAVAGLGREAYGAASVAGTCGSTSTVKDDEYNDDSRELQGQPQTLAIAPIVAYAKSQGLYIGVSLEGSRIFTRDDMNARTYKFAVGRDVTAHDILSGKVPTPPEAEELYAALHSVEFTHEMSCLPRPPEVLRKDSANAWHYDRSTLSDQTTAARSSSANAVSPTANQRLEPFSFLSSMTKEEEADCETFETSFKNFLYGGVSVQRLLPENIGQAKRTGKERRTLWLMLPEVGSLRLGFVSKLSDGEGAAVSNKSSTQRARRDDTSRLSGVDGDGGTVGSDELTLDSALNTRDGSTIGPIRSGNVQLSHKHSVALTDVTVLSQEPMVPIRFKGEDKMEHLRVISIQDVSGTSLLFLANNFREAELLVCGLKLLLERETARLGVRGGVPLTAFGARYLEGAMSPSAARGFRDIPSTAASNRPFSRAKHSVVRKSLFGGGGGYSSSELGDDSTLEVQDIGEKENSRGSRKWGNVPGRNYMRGQAALVEPEEKNGHVEHGVPQYVHGQQVVRDIAKNIRLPLPLPLCRVLLLDSTSPVIKKWMKDRGDKNFETTRWAFPPATPRELERHSSEHQLIATGSMCGAHRTISFDRLRFGSLIRLSEIHTVDADDSKKVVFTVTERSPRRGFSIKARILLREHTENACEATVFAELRPVGKDMSNQAAVHKAFLLVLDEVRHRYGSTGVGLLSGFLSVMDNMENGGNRPGPVTKQKPAIRPFHRTDPISEEKKSDRIAVQTSSRRTGANKEATSGLVSFEDMLKSNRDSPETIPVNRPATPSLQHQIPEADPAKRIAARVAEKSDAPDGFDNGEEGPATATAEKKEPVLVEVKPLPKIRLSLMPSPREEDEQTDESSNSRVLSRPNKSKKKKSSPKNGRTRRSSRHNRI